MVNGISKETFKEFDTDSKLNTLFDYRHEDAKKIDTILAKLEEHPKNCGDRFDSLEKKRVINTVFTGFMGLVGGAGTMIAKLKIWG